MSSLKILPNIANVTDDDASIHLYSNVGPARPLHHTQYDKRITSIMHSTNTYDLGEETSHINEAFKLYSQDDAELTYDSDSTQVEDELDHRVTRRKGTLKKNITKPMESESKFGFSFWSKRFIGLILGFVLTTLLFLNTSLFPDPDALHLTSVEQRIASLEHSLEELQRGSTNTHVILTMVEHIKKSVEKAEEKLSKLDRFADIYALIVNSTNPNSLRRYTDGSLSNTVESFDRSQELEDIAEKVFESFYQKHPNEKNNCESVKYRDLGASKSHAHDEEVVIDDYENGSPFLSESTVSKLSGLNYADYREGARVLGFLTKEGRVANNEKTITRRMFLGWYDFLSSNGIYSPENLRYNANTVLVDGEPSWHCGLKSCSVGIRLSSPIQLRQILLNAPNTQKATGIFAPTEVSIWAKPRFRRHAQDLKMAGNVLDGSSSENPYLKKFFQLLVTQLPQQEKAHVIDVKDYFNDFDIPVRDIYIEISSTKGATGLQSIEVYGMAVDDEEGRPKNVDSFRSELTSSRESLKSSQEQVHPGGVALGDDILS